MNEMISEIIKQINEIDDNQNKKPSFIEKILSIPVFSKINPFAMLVTSPVICVLWVIGCILFTQKHNLPYGGFEFITGVGVLGIIGFSFLSFGFLDRNKKVDRHGTYAVNTMARIKDVFEEENIDKEIFKKLVENKNEFTHRWWVRLNKKIDEYQFEKTEKTIQKDMQEQHDNLLKKLADFGEENREEETSLELKINIHADKIIKKEN